MKLHKRAEKDQSLVADWAAQIWQHYPYRCLDARRSDSMTTSCSDSFWSILCLLLKLADMLTCHVATKWSVRVASSLRTLWLRVNCVALLIKNKMILVNKYTASVVCCRVSQSGSWAGRCVALECCPESCLIFWVITLTALITNGHFATDKILFFNRISSLHPSGFCLWKHTYYTVSDSCTA